MASVGPGRVVASIALADVQRALREFAVLVQDYGGCPGWFRRDLESAVRVGVSPFVALSSPPVVARIAVADVRRVLDLLRWVGRTGWLSDGVPWKRGHLQIAVATAQAGGGLVALAKVAA